MSAALALSFIFGSTPALPKSPLFGDKKPKKEKFGSSLKRLKWDPVKQASVETAGPIKVGTEATGDEALKLETLLVAFDLLVVTRGSQRIVTGLKKDDFLVTEDDRPQQVETFTLGDDASRPRSIILIVDGSASQEPYIQTSTEAAKSLVNQLGLRDKMAIVTDDVELLVDFTDDKPKLANALDKLRKRVVDKQKFGLSAQFTALYAALRELTGDKETRPVIIFQTDGDEASSFPDQTDADLFAFLRRKMPAHDLRLKDIYAAAERTRATIYSVITDERVIDLSADEAYERLSGRRRAPSRPGRGFDPEAERRMKLFTRVFQQGQLAALRVAALSGGWTAWLGKPEDADRIYSQILSDINHRYIIGYYPTNTERDGKLRHVKVEVKGHPEYRVHGRTAYYAPDR